MQTPGLSGITMTEVGFGVELDLYLNIQEAFEEVTKCEHSNHGSHPDAHEGDAQWYLQIQCPKCGDKTGLKAMCDRWVHAIEVGTPIWCLGGCDEFSMDWKVLIKERIGK